MVAKLGGALFGALSDAASGSPAEDGPPADPPPERLPLVPPPDDTFFSPQPVTRASLAAKQSAAKAHAAVIAAGQAASAAKYADFQAKRAEDLSAEATVARGAAVSHDYVQSLRKTVEMLWQQAQTPGGGDPLEIRKARRLSKQGSRMYREGSKSLGDLAELEKAEDEQALSLPSDIAEMVPRLRERLEKQQTLAKEVFSTSERQRKQMETQAPASLHPPKNRLPPELLRPDGHPWWPAKVPKIPAHQEQKIMVIPALGASFL
eukprot:TRINITY_DN14163_c0_g4_i2.p1 TRINITY_DN14163_c0_g4~~TRINITY_DN14163_c0_g4_i2.p1  ORF type:complete len:263 (-),score=73.98 TRINITY_DN14163_c0_g4_i2:229-1017(-)